MADPAWWPVLEALSGGQWHSGQALAERLSISRQAVWKRIERLGDLGVRIEHRRGRGYRLSRELELLDAGRILRALPDAAGEAVADLVVLPEVDSTNAHLERTDARSGSVCLAEMQTGGRGRRGRDWISPLGGNLYCSVAWDLKQGLAAAGGLGLAIAVATVRAIDTLGIRTEIKWPNDVLAEGAKLAGILIEASGEITGPARMIIGVGINVDLGAHGTAIDQEWTDLRTLGVDPSRNELACELVARLFDACTRFERDALAGFLDAWRERDCLAGRPVRVDCGGEPVEGIAAGIDEQGRLLVRREEGLERFFGGEVTVRRV